jgi:polyisoprenoid-binding protein YceI
MKKVMFLAALALLFTTIAIANGTGNEKGVYKVDTKASKIQWVGKKVTGEHSGTLTLSEGNISVKKGRVLNTNISIDMNSIVCVDIEDPQYNQQLVGHLKSDDFFSVAKFPVASFEAKKFEAIAGAKEGEANYTLTGVLTIKGISKEIKFPALVSIDSEALTAKGTAVIDRTEWNIKYGSGSFFEGLGDKMIYDDMEITFDLAAKATAVN